MNGSVVRKLGEEGKRYIETNMILVKMNFKVVFFPYIDFFWYVSLLP